MTRFIIAVVGMCVAASVFFFYTKPAYDDLKNIQAEISQYDLALLRANELQDLKEELLARFNSFLPQDLERLKKLLPDHVDNVRLVLDFDTLASKHSLAIQNVIIGRGDVENGSKGRPSNAEVIGAKQQQYESLTLKFATQGTYDKFVQFMEDIQTSLRIVDLVALSMSPASEKFDGEPVYRYEVTIRTYWLK